MSKFVLDASLALTWRLDDESEPYAESILNTLVFNSAIVPSHWHLEVSNALLMAERKARSTWAKVSSAISLLSALPISVDEHTSLKAFHQTSSFAHSYRLTTYDAAYLELCLRARLPRATLDSELDRAAKSLGISRAAP